MFSEENHLSMKSDSDHKLVWRERGTRYAQKFVCERDRYSTGVMVWAGIMHNSRTPRHIFERRSVTSQRYFRETILDNVCIFMVAVIPNFLFREDNAQPDRSVEDVLGRRVAQRAIPPRTAQELKTACR
ncbi:transposable element Tc1 transposase [Trichonephila clavipes]|nr:transposable element Tc1 transposase [Trichonephila clavipes]